MIPGADSKDDSTPRPEFAVLFRPASSAIKMKHNAEGAAPQDVKLSVGESVDGAT